LSALSNSSELFTFSLKLVGFSDPCPYIVDAEESFEKALAQMAEKRIDSALVKEDGKMVGILTTTDICRVCGLLIEESKSFE